MQYLLIIALFIVFASSTPLEKKQLPVPITGVRLRGGKTVNEGRVEIQVNGIWGTICGNGWTNSQWANGDVVCRGLNYTSGVARIVSAGEIASNTQPIWTDNVRCSIYNQLSNCPNSGIRRVTTCSHTQDAAVTCMQHNRLPVESGNSIGDILPGKYDSIRIQNIDSRFGSNSGVVEVLYNNVWGGVCSSYWTNNDANIVCKELGYESGTVTRATYNPSYIWLNHISCNYNNRYLYQCMISLNTQRTCNFMQQIAAVQCTRSFNNIRLIGGASQSEGYLEILHQNVWGSVCRLGWDDTDATVACREMGFRSGRTIGYGTTSSFYKVPMTSWAIEVSCSGHEQRLSDCPKALISNACIPERDAVRISCDIIVPTSRAYDRVRLSGSASQSMGMVEIYVNGQWSNICSSGWDSNNANKLCIELGYVNGGSTMAYSSTSALYRSASVSHTINCRGNEQYLHQCQSYVSPRSCDSRGAVYVSCLTDNSLQEPSDMAYVHLGKAYTHFRSDGPVYVDVETGRSVVCANNLDNTVATLVCRTLSNVPSGMTFNVGQMQSSTSLSDVMDDAEFLMVIDNCPVNARDISECKYQMVSTRTIGNPAQYCSMGHANVLCMML